MNATLPNPGASQRRRSSADEVAAELLTAGEALCRAARAIGGAGQPGADGQGPRSNGDPRPSLPAGERLSGKQLGAIRAASRRAGLSRDQLGSLIEGLTGKVEPVELSRQDASVVLDKLSAMTGYAR